MTPDERRRAGAAIRERMTQIDMTATQLAGKAGVHPSTVRRLIRGDVWPQERTRRMVLSALGMPADGTHPLAAYSTAELARELFNRLASTGP